MRNSSAFQPTTTTKVLAGCRLIFGLSALFVVVVYGVTYWGTPPWDGWLYRITTESGPFEIASASLLIAIGGWCLYLVSWQRHCFSSLDMAALLVLGFLGLIGAGEEVSWGHHWFNYEPSAFFIENNLQQETNLHNFMPAERFSFIIGLFTYGPFLFLPLIYHLSPQRALFQLLDRWQLHHFMPGMGCAFMMLFANLNQAWLMPAAYPDNIAASLALLLALALLIKQGRRSAREHWLIWLFCMLFLGLCLQLSSIFRHNNTQYEIRECLMIFVIGYWLLEWTFQKLLAQHTVQPHSLNTTMD